MSHPRDAAATPSPRTRRGVLDWIEFIGNKLPDPAMIFIFGALIVMALSWIGANAGWSVPEMRAVPQTDPATGKAGFVLQETGKTIAATNLLSADGIYWMVATMVSNFINFPPLGIVLVGMLGVGVAERTGLIGAALKAMMLVTPMKMLTPMMVFLGVMSSVGSDAGYIILPPLAAALYKSVGRSPLAGIAAVFAGVSGGFSANLLISGGDAVMAGLSTSAAQIFDPKYTVSPTANWYFMIVSTFLLTVVGWAVTAWFVEPRLKGRPADEGGAVAPSAEDLKGSGLKPEESRGLRWALVGMLAALGVCIACIAIPGWPLSGATPKGMTPAGARWAQSIVPIVFVCFLVPGAAYGFGSRQLRKSGAVIGLMTDSMKAMAPIIVLSFFAAQFIAYFNHSNLGRMLALAGGESLAKADLPKEALIVIFVVVTAAFNLLVSSMSAKYAMLAPIFVPMLMVVGVSPELTQMAYRVGDSCTNIITPMNAYMVIILVVMQRFAPKAGMGTMMSMMLPYTVLFLVSWCVLMVLWIQTGQPLGPAGPLKYIPAQ